MKHLVFAFGLMAWVTLAAPLASAQAPDPVDERSASFEAVEGAADEQVSGLSLMVASYALIWLFTLAFVARMARLEGSLAAEVERLEKALPDQDS